MIGGTGTGWRLPTREEVKELFRRTHTEFDVAAKQQRGEQYWTGRTDNMGLGFRTVRQ